jgi:hypothetical protein
MGHNKISDPGASRGWVNGFPWLRRGYNIFARLTRAREIRGLKRRDCPVFFHHQDLSFSHSPSMSSDGLIEIIDVGHDL